MLGLERPPPPPLLEDLREERPRKKKLRSPSKRTSPKTWKWETCSATTRMTIERDEGFININKCKREKERSERKS